MGSLLNFEKCSSCGGHHNFYLTDPNGFSMSARYRFVCPKTQEAAVMRPSMAHNLVNKRPADSVEVTADVRPD